MDDCFISVSSINFSSKCINWLQFKGEAEICLPMCRDPLCERVPTYVLQGMNGMVQVPCTHEGL